MKLSGGACCLSTKTPHYEAQAWILHTQIAAELLVASRYPFVLCDRAVIGNYAYLAQANGEVSALDQLVDSWLSTYKRIVLVSLLDELSAEGMCAAEPLLQHAIDVRVRGELERCGVTFVELTEVAHERWLDLVEALRSMTSSPTVGLALTRRF